MINHKVEVVLQGLADALNAKVAPVLADNPYAFEQTRLVTVVLGVLAGQIDGLAAVRAGENAAMRALFGDAASIVGGDLEQRLTDAAASIDPGLKISELDVEGARLRLLLVELHAALESIAGADALAMHQRIWRLLREMEMGRG